MKAVDLRGFAREWTDGCLIRIPGVCRWTPTCLCHDRTAGTAGGSQKPHDFVACIGCQDCHDVIDRRTHLHVFTYEQILMLRHEGLVRTYDVYSKRFDMVPK